MGRLVQVALCGPQGTALEGRNALRWSATMAGEAHPVPSRTRKLSPRAPMVLRSESVGEQDVADQRRAFPLFCREGPGGTAPTGPYAMRGPPRAGCVEVVETPIPGPGRPRGAYSYTLRGGAARRTLKTGYCDR